MNVHASVLLNAWTYKRTFVFTYLYLWSTYFAWSSLNCLLWHTYPHTYTCSHASPYVYVHLYASWVWMNVVSSSPFFVFFVCVLLLWWALSFTVVTVASFHFEFRYVYICMGISTYIHPVCTYVIKFLLHSFVVALNSHINNI